MSCTHLCQQGRFCTCAVVAFAAETEGVMPMATGCTVKAAPNTHYCDKSRQSCATPWTCSPVCKLVTTNSDGTSAHTPCSSTWPTLRWFVVLIVSTALAALSVQHGARFFN